MRILAIALAASCSLLLPAHAQQPQPGLWQVTTKSSGMGGPPRDHTSTSCITPEQTKNLQSGFGPPENPQMPCKRTNYQQQGNKVTFNVQCTMPNATSEGTGTFIFDTPTHYTAVMTNSINMQGQKITTTTNIEGRRIGECPAK
jgi:hypothetical protein